MQPLPTDIVLLGAGHAHVEVLRRQASRPMPGVRLTVIGRERFTPYSGMLPGLIRGDYQFGQAHIDITRLAAAAGARLVLAEADAIDLPSGRVGLSGHDGIRYDLLSIDVGGMPAMPPGAGVQVKPIGRFLNALNVLQANLTDRAQVAVVGGGPGGAELVLALAYRLPRIRLILISRASSILPTAPERARRRVRQALAAAGVDVRCGAAALRHADGLLELADGTGVPVDVALWATGVVAPEFLSAAGLDCDQAGCVRVAATLCSISHSRVFAAGDCADVTDARLPKSGVWAVRAGAVLSDNLGRLAAGRPLRVWHPQRTALAILGAGDGRAVAWRNGLTVSGRLPWWWKDRIDRRWITGYQLP